MEIIHLGSNVSQLVTQKISGTYLIPTNSYLINIFPWRQINRINYNTNNDHPIVLYENVERMKSL